MVTFILGNSIKKRASYKTKNAQEEVYIDDMHLCADAVKGGVYYFATCKRPFLNMRAIDFVAYSRVLFDEKSKENKRVKSLLKSLGYNASINKKIGKVKSEDYIKILLASKVKDCTKSVYINLDAWKYNGKNVRKIKNLILSLSRYDLHFLVSDFRFCALGSYSVYQKEDGNSFCLDNIEQRKRARKNKIGALIKSVRG